MAKVVHLGSQRGQVNHGWLMSYHSFSFGSFYDPSRIRFGLLRVLNDDTVAPGMGFGTHPHDNMEIISIPLSGALEHKDSLGTVSIIQSGEIQVMSAGSGISHSEFNHSLTEAVQFLQIWIFPNQKNVPPRYGQIQLENLLKPNTWQMVVGPPNCGLDTWVHQNCWLHLGHFEAATTCNYQLKQNGNGVYVFVITGSITIDGEKLSSRDAIGLTEKIELSIQIQETAQVLIIEIPMHNEQ